MTRTILVAPTEPGVGLTAVCLGLVHALRERGVDVGYFKPLAQPRSHGRHDGRTAALIRLVTNLEPPHSISADEVDKALGSNAQEALMERVVGLSEPLHSRHDVVVVEGLVPGAGLVYAGRANVALAKALDADVLLVSAGRDGRTPEDVAESVAIAAGMFQVGEHPRVAGAFVNLLPDSAPGTVQALRNAVSDRGVELVGALPYRSELTWPRLRDLMADLEIEVLSRGDVDRRVKDIVIGAQGVPGILPLLREGVLVIVPGDRHELILSACLAAMNGTRLAGLLLALGTRPDPRGWGLCPPGAAPRPPGLGPRPPPRPWGGGALPAGRGPRPAGPGHADPHLRDCDDPARDRSGDPAGRRGTGRRGDDRGGRRPRSGVARRPADGDPSAAAEPAGVPTATGRPRAGGPSSDRPARGWRAADRAGGDDLPSAGHRPLRPARGSGDGGVAGGRTRADPSRRPRDRRSGERRTTLRGRVGQRPGGQGDDARHGAGHARRPDHVRDDDAAPGRGRRPGGRRDPHHGGHVAAGAAGHRHGAGRAARVVGLFHVPARRRRHLRRLRGEPRSR